MTETPKTRFKTNQTVPKPESTKSREEASSGLGSKEELAPAKKDPDEDNLLLAEDSKYKLDFTKSEMYD